MNKNFDRIDLKILGEIAKNARTPFTRIAKAIRVNPDTVRYRIEQFEKKGIIQGYRTRVNIQGMGYQPYHSFVKLKGNHKEFEEKIKTHPFVRSLIRFVGTYEYDIAFIARSTEEALTFEILMRTKEVEEIFTLPLAKILAANVLPPNITHIEYQKETDCKPMDIDENDFKILKCIATDARLPAYQIAKQTQLTLDIVLYRLKKMQEYGVIKGFVPFFNIQKLGLTFTVLLVQTPNQKQLESVCKTIPTLAWAASLLGNWNGLLYLFHENEQELHETIDLLKEQVEIKDMRILSQRDQGYYNYFPDILLS